MRRYLFNRAWQSALTLRAGDGRGVPRRAGAARRPGPGPGRGGPHARRRSAAIRHAVRPGPAAARAVSGSYVGNAAAGRPRHLDPHRAAGVDLDAAHRAAGDRSSCRCSPSLIAALHRRRRRRGRRGAPRPPGRVGGQRAGAARAVRAALLARAHGDPRTSPSRTGIFPASGFVPLLERPGGEPAPHAPAGDHARHRPGRGRSCGRPARRCSTSLSHRLRPHRPGQGPAQPASWSAARPAQQPDRGDHDRRPAARRR